MCCSVKIWDIVFQSTLPREERRLIRGFVFKTDMISIHAPTRGATMVADAARATTRFQSTLPREERLMAAADAAVTTDFNPRSHERSDLHQFKMYYVVR